MKWKHWTTSMPLSTYLCLFKHRHGRDSNQSDQERQLPVDETFNADNLSTTRPQNLRPRQLVGVLGQCRFRLVVVF